MIAALTAEQAEEDIGQLAAVEDGRIEGSAHLALEMRANGSHRAEAMKLLVHRPTRRRGL